MADSKYIELPPSPSSSISGLREIGYTINTAVADIIDNSVTAGASNIWVKFVWAEENSYVSILDDGKGMDDEDLESAMRPGSKNPNDERNANDLGRFSLGLKTASWSQANKLYVWSKTQESKVHSLGWDIEEVEKRDKWVVEKDLKKSRDLQDLEELDSGTLIEWHDLKLVSDMSNVSAGTTSRDEFNHFIDDLEKYLGMIFHRFIDGKNKLNNKLKIFLNDDEIPSWDPFSAGVRVQSQRTPDENLEYKDCRISIKGYVLPHKDLLETGEFEQGGGREGWLKHQGFFVYRSDRLIVPGDWLGLGRGGKKWQDEEQYRLARLSIDIPNAIDKDWSLDLKKEMTVPPKVLREKLTRHAEEVREKARQSFVKRGKYGPRPKRSYFDDIRVWENGSRLGKVVYKVNNKHPAIAQFVSSIGPFAKSFKRIVRLIEECVPVQQMWIDSTESDISVPFDGTEEELVGDIRAFYDLLTQSASKTHKQACEIIKNSEPYNRYPQLVDKELGD